MSDWLADVLTTDARPEGCHHDPETVTNGDTPEQGERSSDLREQPRGDRSDSGDTPPAVTKGNSPGTPARPGPPAAPRVAWTAAELMGLEFSPPRWAVPGVIAEGVTVLAGAPKVGKSWLSLGLGISVAAGGRALGSIPVEAGEVLYLALEDTPRRLQSRLRTVLGESPAPVGLHLVIACPPFPEASDRIAAWLDQHPDCRMVIIDVYAKLRGATPAGMSAYDADYLGMSRVKAIADAYGIAVVLIHHVRKITSDDFLSDLSGTNGLSGGADTVAVVRRARGEAEGVLHITGRDVDEAELGIAFMADSGSWKLLAGPALEYTLTGTRREIYRYVKTHEGAGPAEIAAAIGADVQAVKQTARRMSDAGQLDTTGRGRYVVPEPPAGIQLEPP